MRRISKGYVMIAIGIVIAAVSVAGYFRYCLDSMNQGPLLTYALRKDPETWTRNGMNADVHEKIFLGSFPFKNRGKSPIEILSVEPSHSVSGLSLIKPVVIDCPPGLGSGPLSWMEQQPNGKTAHQIPFTLQPSEAYEPGLEMVATKKGTYVNEWCHCKIQSRRPNV